MTSKITQPVHGWQVFAFVGRSTTEKAARRFCLFAGCLRKHFSTACLRQKRMSGKLYRINMARRWWHQMSHKIHLATNLTRKYLLYLSFINTWHFVVWLIIDLCIYFNVLYYQLPVLLKQEVKVIWQKAPHGGPIPRLGVTPGGRNLYHWIPGVGVPISVP